MKKEIRYCELCGAVSIPWFGFAFPCKGKDGMHRRIKTREGVDYDYICKKMADTYRNISPKDRGRFERNADKELKKMVERGKKLLKNKKGIWW